MTEWQVYLWLMLDNLQFVWFVFLVLGVLSVIAIPVSYECSGYKEEVGMKCLKFFTIPSMTLLLIAVIVTLFIPSSKQYAMIKVFPKMANSEMATELQQDVPEMYQMAKDYMKDLLTKEDLMKVKEMIYYLQEMPQEASVVHDVSVTYGEWTEIRCMGVNKDKTVVILSKNK